MTLQEIFDQLSSSEFSQLSIGGLAQGVLNNVNKGKVIPSINLGLQALHTRFTIREGATVLELVPDLFAYTLHSKYAVSNTASTQLVKYIRDDLAMESFADDVLKVERITMEDGFDLELNDEHGYYAASTPESNVIWLPVDIVNQIDGLPDAYKGETVEVTYRANHKKIALTSSLTEDLVRLPMAYLEPLLYFVASRLHSPTGGANANNTADPWFQKFEIACRRLEVSGVQTVTRGSDDKLRSRGFC